MMTNELPWNSEAEQRLLSIFITKPLEAPETIDKLVAEMGFTSEDFYSQTHRTIYKTILELINENINIDFATIIHKLNLSADSAEFTTLKEILSVYAPSSSAAHYAKMLRELRKRREFMTVSQSIINLAADTSQDFEEIKGTIEKLLKFEDNTPAFRSMRDIFVDVYAEIVECYSRGGQIPGCKTGWYNLDRALGGIANGELVVIGARPGMGKSVVAQNIAEYAAVGEQKTVVMFSLEMPDKQIGKRVVSSASCIPYENIKNGKLNPEEFKEIMDVINAPGYEKILVHKDSTVSLSFIKSLCRAQKRINNGLGLVIIDYLQLISSPPKINNRLEAVSEITRELKLLAKELDCPVIALSQLNRSNEKEKNKRPQLSDLRESGSIEQDADKVILLYRDEYYHKDTVDKGIIEFNIAKSRDGRTGTVKLSWQPQIMRVMNPQDVEKVAKRRKQTAEQMSIEERKG